MRAVSHDVVWFPNTEDAQHVQALKETALPKRCGGEKEK